jgi:DNA primase
VGRGLIADELINQVKDRVDIADIVSHHVSLTKAGQNLKGLCPFHQEKNPSFTVSPSRQIFHCFGCGAGGNVFTFLSRITGSSFPEVVRDLGRKVGIEIAESAGPGHQAGPVHRVEKINQAAAAWFQQSLLNHPAGKGAREYLDSRGIAPETINKFGVGVAPAEWDGLLRVLTQQGFAPAEVATAGLIVPRDNGSGFYDRFRGRVMFTITDLRKRVVGFGGRVLGEGMPKYLNSPETPLFKKGQTLFALDQAREAISRTKTVVIVEGYFDAIALHQAGLSHTVATLGTALTPEHIQLIRRFATNVVLLFDPDAAGVRAALRGLDLFVNSGLGVKVITLPSGEDPDTFIRKDGPEAFAKLEAAAPSLLDYALNYSVTQATESSLEGRIRSVDELLRILQKSEHPIEREERIRVVAERLGVSQQRLIERYPVVLADKPSGMAAGKKPVALGTVGALFKNLPEERDLVLLLLQGKLSQADVRRLRPEAFTVPACRRLIDLALEHVDADGRISLRSLLDVAVEDPDCGSLVTELSLKEEHFDDVAAHIKDCFERLDQKQAGHVLRELIAQLKTAEREERWDDARTINMQVNELRMRKAGTPTAGVVSLVKE